MKLRMITVALFAFLVSSPAIAQNDGGTTIGKMRSACEVQRTLNANPTSSDMFNAGFCSGWAASKVHWRNAACVYVKEGSDPGAFALGQERLHGRTLDQCSGASVSELVRRHPQLWSQPLVYTSVDTSLFAEFPCKAGN